MMDDRQERELIGGGDTLLHFHLSDRATNAGLQADARVLTLTDDYDARVDDDFLLFDTTAGAVTTTLPLARNGKEITVTLLAGTYQITVNPQSGETIMGEPDCIITDVGTSITFKAVTGNWIAI